MSRSSLLAIHLLTFTTITAAPVLAQEAVATPPRATLTVAEFATDRTVWMPPPRLGETLAELLTDRLVTAGSYKVMDRSWLDAAQDRRGLPPLELLRQRALEAGIDFVVLGSVTELTIEKNSTSRLGVLPLPLTGGVVKKHKTESAIGLTLRVIDVRTGEVVATSSAHSAASHANTSGGGVTLVGHLPLLGGTRSSTLGVQDRLLVTAVEQAITAAADQIVGAAPKLSRK